MGNHTSFVILLTILKAFFHTCPVGVATEVYIPKVKPPNPNNIKDFRPISLLNVEGKLFFRLVSKRLECHIITNNRLINSSIQKGCMIKIPGCWEHMSMVWNELKSSKSQKGSLAAIWLDIANAYGSVPHQLTFFALRRYGVPEHWVKLIMNYYKGLCSISQSSSAPSSWHHHLRGIFIGCTTSIILFLSAINVVIEYICNCHVFREMDDLFLQTSSVVSTELLLQRCTFVLSWARMSFRASKSRSIVIQNGRVLDVSPFSFDNEAIPSIHSNPVRFLGRSIDVSLCDRQVLYGLELINKSFHRGIHKVWILQHLFIPRLRGPLKIYEISVSVVLQLEQKISSHLRSWLRLHHSTTNICLYSSISPCPLPIKSLTSVLKAAKVSGHLLLRESADEFVASCNPALKSGFWNVADAVVTAESRLEFQKLLGYHQTNRAGFGSFHQPEIPHKDSHAYRKLISSVLKDEDEDLFRAKAVQLHLQGYWMRWCDFIKNDFSWKSLLKMPSFLLSFCLNATYGTLPSPSNLKRWQITTEASCFLCKKKVCTSAHILGACQVALQQQRFTYRHDSVLMMLVSVLSQFLSSFVPSQDSSTKMIFVKEGQTLKNIKKKPNTGLLHSAPKWKLLYDCNGSPTIPSFLAVTTLRPDIVLYACGIKTVIILELTCPCEENMPYWHDTKEENYHSLCSAIRSNGWKVSFFAVEVGARWYCAESLLSCLRCLGLPSKLCRSTIKNLSSISLKWSFDIWMARNSCNWKLETSYPSNFHQVNSLSPSSVTVVQPKTRKVPTTPSSTRTVFQTNSPKVPAADTVQKLRKHVHCGLFNKGNTCYVNVILQAVRPLSAFWSDSSTPLQTTSPLASSFRRVMAKLDSSKSCVDPSFFLTSLTNSLRKSGRASFDINTQQDAVEILEHILSELLGGSAVASRTLSIKILTDISCNSCFQSSPTEDCCVILQLPVRANIQSSLNSLFISECLEGVNALFCHVCHVSAAGLLRGRFLCCEVGLRGEGRILKGGS